MHSPALTPYDDDLIDELLEKLAELSELDPAGAFADLVARDAELTDRLTGDVTLTALLEERYVALRQMAGLFDNAKHSQHGQPKIPGFHTLNVLGYGGAGVVYRAHQTSLKREVALKLMLGGRFASPRSRERFRREAETIARLHHPHIAEVYDHGEYEGLPYLVQELLSGGSLAERIRRQPLTPLAAAQLVQTVAQAVHYAHQNGVVHRDLKPANILLATSGEPKVIDFGLAKVLDSENGFTRTGETPGTPSYMAPEQITGAPVGLHTDIYGLGAILFELAFGEPPFTGGTSTAIFERILNTAPTAVLRQPHRVPIELQSITFKCLEKDPKHRYATAADLANDLGRFLADEPVRARASGAFERIWKWSRRRPAIAALVAMSACLLLLLLAGSAIYSIRLTNALNLAEAHRREAETRKAESEQKQLALRQQLYVADITAAYKAYQQNNIVQMQELLTRHRPRADETDLRGFPWHFLNRLAHAERLTLQGHVGDVFSVIYSPDGKRLATCGKDQTVRLWNAADGKPMAVFSDHTKELNAIAFTPDGQKLVSGGDDGVFIWELLQDDTKAGKQAAPNRLPTSLVDLRQGVRAVAISPDGATLAVGGQSRVVELVPLLPSGQRGTLPAHPTTVICLLFSRDGKTLFSTAGDQLFGWNLQTLARNVAETAHPTSICTLSLSHDGKLLASADALGNVLCRDATTFERLAPFVTGHGRVDALTFSPDDHTLAIGGKDRHFELWDVATRTRRETIRGHAGSIWSAEFAPDGSAIATASADGLARIWDLPTTNASRLTTNSNHFEAIAFSPNSQILAAGTGSGEIELWDTKSARQVKASKCENNAKPAGSARTVVAVAFSPDGQQLASSHVNGTVRLWNAMDLTPRGELFGQKAAAGSVAFSPDGRILAVGAWDRNDCARLWHLDTKQSSPVTMLWCGTNWVQYPSRAPWLAVGSDHYNKFQFSDPENPSQHSVLFFEGDRSQCFAITEDGNLVATGGGSSDRGVYLWDTRTGKCRASFVGHEEAVTSLAFCSDQRTLASTSHDGTVRLWDLSARQEVIKLDLSGAGKACAFSPDGQTLAAAAVLQSGAGDLYVWSAGVSTAVTPSAVSAIIDGLPDATSTESGETQAARMVGTPLEKQLSEGHCYVHPYNWLTQASQSRGYPLVAPTFEERVHDGIISHGAIAFSAGARAKKWTGRVPELDHVAAANIRRLFQHFNGGAPLPNQAAAAIVQGEVYNHTFQEWAVLLLPETAVERRDIPIAAIGATEDLFERFRRVHRWAKAHGFAGGFPTFIDEVTNGRATYGAVLIKPGMGEEVWIPVNQLVKP